jgi:hypothetical protein
MRIFTQRRRRGLLAAVAALGLAGPAQAQYAPYNGGQSPYGVTPQYGATTQYGAATPNYAVQQQRPAAYGAAQQQSYSAYVPQQQAPAQPTTPQYAAQGAYQGYAGAQYGYQPQTPAYGPNYAAPRVAMNYQGGGTVPGPEALPTTPETVPAGPVQNGGSYVPTPAQTGSYVPAPTPAVENYGYGGGAVGGYETYSGAGAAGCATGNCNTGYGGYGAACAAPYGACDSYSSYGGMSGVLSKHAGCGYWFGGAYGLFMDRDESYKYPLVFAVADGAPNGYYPPSSAIVLRSRDAEVGYQPGVEVRFGRTFGCAPVNPCDPCGCGACMPKWGLEGVYWTLFEEDDEALYVDQATLRTYSMMPMSGLETNMTGTYRPVNEYFDYAPPVVDPSPAPVVTVTLARVRNSFEFQNVELNLLRLSVCGGGVNPAAYTCDYGASCGGCATGGMGACDPCATGCAPCAPRGSRFSCTGVCGFRWMQLDEDWLYGINFTGATTGFLNYRANTENNLFGAQIGCNGMYRIGCKWGLHVNSAVGLFGNDIDVRQYMESPTNNTRFIGTGENFDVRAYKTDVSMLGELRLGASYQATCHCRLYGGWRALGITGLALATDQAPTQFIDAAQLRNYVNSNGSMILHGLQAGVEWNY